MRYVFGHSLSWSEELARYLFLWQIWLGVSYAAKNRTHLRITVVRDCLSETKRRVLEVAVTLVWLGFAVFVTIQGFNLAFKIGAFGQTSAAMRLPMVYAYLSVPVGCLLMIIRLCENLIKDYVRDRKTKGETA